LAKVLYFPAIAPAGAIDAATSRIEAQSGFPDADSFDEPVLSRLAFVSYGKARTRVSAGAKDTAS
jgi:hypothetical protein